MQTKHDDESGHMLVRDVKREVISQIGKWLVAALVLLLGIAVAGWIFYLKAKVTDIVGGVPVGTVAAFDLSGECPLVGWKPFEDGNSRFIVGAGTQDLLSTRKFREIGDTEQVVLSTDNLPSHQHDTQLAGALGEWGNGPYVEKALQGANAGRFVTIKTSPSGMAEPKAISIVPPFIALKYCVKT